jgi:hypothetical protein
MSSITLVNQTCPVCGRNLQVAVELLGQTVKCRICHGEFLAREESRLWHSDVSLLERADNLLATSASFRNGSGRTCFPQ